MLDMINMINEHCNWAFFQFRDGGKGSSTYSARVH